MRVVISSLSVILIHSSGSRSSSFSLSVKTGDNLPRCVSLKIFFSFLNVLFFPSILQRFLKIFALSPFPANSCAFAHDSKYWSLASLAFPATSLNAAFALLSMSFAALKVNPPVKGISCSCRFTLSSCLDMSLDVRSCEIVNCQNRTFRKA